MSEIPFNIFILFIGLALSVFLIGLIMGLRRIEGSPFICLFAGIFLFVIFVMTEDITGIGSNFNSTNIITPSQVDYMDLNIGTAVTKLSSGGVNNIFAGEEIVNTNSMLYNKRIDQVCMSLSKTGAPTGTVNIAVYDSVITPTQANYLYLLGTKDSTTLTTTQTSYCFIGIDTYITTTNQAIGAFFIGGSAGNEVNVFSNTTGNLFDGTNSIRTRYVASWSDFSTTDTRMSVSLNSIQENNINYSDKYSLNQNDVWVYMLFVSFFFMFIGVMLQLKDWSRK